MPGPWATATAHRREGVRRDGQGGVAGAELLEKGHRGAGLCRRGGGAPALRRVGSTACGATGHRSQSQIGLGKSGKENT